MFEYSQYLHLMQVHLIKTVLLAFSSSGDGEKGTPATRFVSALLLSRLAFVALALAAILSEAALSSSSSVGAAFFLATCANMAVHSALLILGRK